MLSFLGSLVSALPKIIDAVRSWKQDKAIAEEEGRKNQRNREAMGNDIKPPSENGP